MKIMITMTKDQKGSENGIKLNDYAEGKTYDMAEGLANAFIKDIRCARLATNDEADNLTLVYEDAAAQVKAEAEAAEKELAEAETKKKVAEAEAKALAIKERAKIEAELDGARKEADAKAKAEADAIEAKVDKARNDPTPDETTTDAPDERAVVTEDEVETPDEPEILMSSDGSPYTNARYARAALKRRGLKESHEEVVVNGGFGLRAKQTPKRTRGD